MSTLAIGAHVEQTDPVAEALARDTTLVQFFLGDPQGYKGPEVRYDGVPVGIEQDVVDFDVAMNDALPMGVSERLGDVDADADDELFGERRRDF